MQKIILTGYNDKDFLKMFKKKIKAGCYICKRRQDDEAVFITEEDEDERDIGSTRLRFSMLKVNKGDMEFHFLLCHECSIFLEGFVGNLGKVNLSLTKHSVN